jgi:hypothetical protein
MYFRKVYLPLLLVPILLVACGQPAEPFGEAANVPHEHSGHGAASTPDDQSADLQPVLATSELIVGPNRVALGLLENNVPIPDAAETTVKVRYYRVINDQATLIGEEDARYYGEGLGNRGTYIVHPTFDTPGAWGLEVIAERPEKGTTTRRIGVNVAQTGNAVGIGMPAPKSNTPTAAQDLRTISSDTDPDPRLHQMSVAEAVTSGKPSLILFATPGFCQTAVCGPGVDVVQRLVDTFGDRINAVHVEIYQHPFERLQQVAAMKEWGLQTEPWLFLVDETGQVTERFEGGITFEELEPVVARLVG